VYDDKQDAMRKIKKFCTSVLKAIGCWKFKEKSVAVLFDVLARPGLTASVLSEFSSAVSCITGLHLFGMFLYKIAAYAQTLDSRTATLCCRHARHRRDRAGRHVYSFKCHGSGGLTAQAVLSVPQRCACPKLHGPLNAAPAVCCEYESDCLSAHVS